MEKHLFSWKAEICLNIWQMREKSSENCEEIKLSPNLAIGAAIKMRPLRYTAVTFREFF